MRYVSFLAGQASGRLTCTAVPHGSNQIPCGATCRWVVVLMYGRLQRLGLWVSVLRIYFIGPRVRLVSCPPRVYGLLFHSPRKGSLFLYTWHAETLLKSQHEVSKSVFVELATTPVDCVDYRSTSRWSTFFAAFDSREPRHSLS